MEGLERAFADQHEPTCRANSRYPGEFALVPAAFSAMDTRAARIADIKRALESGAYGVAAHLLAACLMLEMVR
jgi:hypothetical protein